MLDSKEFLTIIGSPRSGTTMLQILLASHPQVASTVEQTLFTQYVPLWRQTWESEVENIEKRGWKLGLPILWKEEELDDVLRDFLTRAYTKIHAGKPEATHILDKHPGYSFNTPLIRRYLPRTKFIHMIRDGRDVVSSMVAVHAKMGFVTNDIRRGAHNWKRFLNAAREAKQYGSDYLEVRYEDFLNKGTEAYAQVLEFCGLPADAKWIEETLAANTFEKMKERGASPDPKTKLSEKRYHRGKAGGWRTDFTARDRFVFDQVAGDLLCELGYAEPGWWAQNSAELLLQPWRFRVEKRMPMLVGVYQHAKAAMLGRNVPDA